LFRRRGNRKVSSEKEFTRRKRERREGITLFQWEREEEGESLLPFNLPSP
jgi:hypothetical protein